MENGEIIHGICKQGYIPVRKDPHEGSEMVTQILFGEYVRIEKAKGSWCFIRALKDGYEGWIDRKCIERTEKVADHPLLVARSNIRIRNLTDQQPVILPIGSSVPAIRDQEFTMAGTSYGIDNAESLISPGKITMEVLIGELISIPYIWGGRCGFGFDCSGLTQFLARLSGMEIPRDASEQAAIGTTLNFTSEAKTGDFAFFDNTEGMIHHVGMMIGNDRIIHASGMVRIDRIDQQGIYNEKLGAYTYKLRVIKRIA